MKPSAAQSTTERFLAARSHFTLLAGLGVCAALLVLSGGGTGAEPSAVGIEANKEQITFSAGKDLVAKYHIAPTVAKPYFWPLQGAGGVPLTRAWPMVKGEKGETTDHPHQKSAWFCHGDVIVEGFPRKDKVKKSDIEGVDFWSEAGNHGKIVCVEVGEPKLNKNHGQIATKNEWRNSEGKKLLDETRTIHLYDFGDTRLFVLDIDLHASVGAIEFGDTKEGSFGIRINDTIREGAMGKGKLENADGKVGEKNLWGHKSVWCDYSGPIDGKVVGVAILDDPTNSPAACWHSRGYGLMAANPFGRADSDFPAMKDNKDRAKVAKGGHLKLRYGMLLHPGDAKEGKIADYYQRFVKLKDEGK
ncbi:MAG: PmoA family protein [Gemmataceae bacterium]|nr:PmoA family protein [Gemmataceae bacterium]